MIQANTLSFGYKKGRRLFSDLSLSIPKGSIVGLLGRNGEGKSTLMKLITGQLIAQEGVMMNQSYNTKHREVELLQRVFMLHEDVSVPNISIRDYFGIITPFYPSYDETIANELIETFEIDWSWKLGEVSLGQRKKALIALALSLRTPLLLLDEPTNGLDIPSKSVFRRLLAKYSSEEQTIIISTHQVRDLEQLIDHILMLDKNKIVCNKSIADLTERLIFAPVTTDNAHSALYKEGAVMGEFGVWARQAEEEESGNFSMELFFNAMIAERRKLQYILEV